MATYRLLAGTHVNERGEVVEKGGKFTTKHPLEKMFKDFRERFECLDNTDEDMDEDDFVDDEDDGDEDGDAEKTAARPEKKKTTRKRKTKAKGPEDVSDEFPTAAEEGVKVFLIDGGYFVAYDGETEYQNKEALAKDDVADFISKI